MSDMQLYRLARIKDSLADRVLFEIARRSHTPESLLVTGWCGPLMVQLDEAVTLLVTYAAELSVPQQLKLHTMLVGPVSL